MTSARRALRAGLSVAVSVGLAVALLARLDPVELARLGAGADPAWLLAAAALGPLQVGLTAWRWRLASARLGQELSPGRAVREVALSNLLNQVLPGGVAGDAVRAWRARTEAVPLGPAVRAVVIDRAVGLAVHLCLVLVGIGAWTSLHPGSAPPWGVAAVALALLGAFASGLAGRWSGALGLDARRALRGSAGAAQVGLSIALTASFLLGFAACGRAVGQELGAATVTVIPVVLLSMALPLSVAGWGLREATAALLLSRIGVEEEAAVVVSATYGVSALLGALPGALVPLWGRA